MSRYGYEYRRRSSLLSLAGAFSFLSCATLLLSASGMAVMIAQTEADRSQDQTETVGQVIPTQTAWSDFGFSRTFGKRSAPATRSGVTNTQPSGSVQDFWRSTKRARKSDRPRSQYGSYRTVCVRLCDGYYWPVSFTASKGSFRADAQICKSSCGAPTKLFYYSNPGQTPDQMVDLRGRPYANLEQAFAYRKAYNPSCTCGAQPWEQAAQERHAMYAQLKREGRLKTYLAKLSKKQRRQNRRRTSVAWQGQKSGAAQQGTATRARGGAASNVRVVRGVRAMGLGATSRGATVIRAPRASRSSNVVRPAKRRWQRSAFSNDR